MAVCCKSCLASKDVNDSTTFNRNGHSPLWRPSVLCPRLLPSSLTHSRSRGSFAGVSLEGLTLRPDNNANKKVYGKNVSARSIVLENAVPAPASAEPLIAVLNQYGESPTAKSASDTNQRVADNKTKT